MHRVSFFWLNQFIEWLAEMESKDSWMDKYTSLSKRLNRDEEHSTVVYVQFIDEHEYFHA